MKSKQGASAHLYAAARTSGYTGTYEEFLDDLRSHLRGNDGYTGATGQKGDPGRPGDPGTDAWDKYSWSPLNECMIQLEWKGISFEFPVARESASAFPSGKLNYGDVAFIQMVYGNDVFERMAAFWRREYEYQEDMALFTNEEDKCNLKDINKSNLYPDHFRAYSAKPSAP